MEYRHFFLSKYLQKHGVKPTIISASFHHLYTNPPRVEGNLLYEKHDGVQFCFIKTLTYEGNGIKRLLNTIEFTLKLNINIDEIVSRFGKPDIVIGSTPHPFIYYNLIKLKRKFSIPTIFEVRDLWPLMLHELGSLSRINPLSWIFSWIERKSFKNTDLTLSLWHTASDYMFQHGLDRKKYHYLPNGIELKNNLKNLPVEESSLLDKVITLKKKGKFIIGYCGSHGFANPLDMIIDCCIELQKEKNDKIIFYLVGNGPEKKRIMKRAEENGLKNVCFNDYVSKSTVMAFLKKIDIAFMGLKDLPLFKYGPTPNKLMDYLAMSKPIIYAINSSFDPVKECGAGITIPAGNPSKLMLAVQILEKTQPAKLMQMGMAGRKYAEANLDYENLATKLYNILKSINSIKC